MSTREIAHSYAQALYELGAEAGIIDRLEEDLRYGWELISGSELYPALRHPLIPRGERLALVREIFAGLEPYVRNLLLLLVERGRVAHLGEIFQEFIALREEREGLAHVQVSTPYPLDGLRDLIKERLEEVTGREIRLEERLDRSLIGGIRIRMGDLVLDGSVRAQLERLREELLEEGGGRWPRHA